MTRWIIANVIGGISGVWSGALVLDLLLLSAWSILQFQNCSGIPCGEGVFSSFLISIVVGSVVGGVVGYVTTQGILQRTFTKRGLLSSALVGLILAPIVGVLFSLVLFVFLPLIDAIEAAAPQLFDSEVEIFVIYYSPLLVVSGAFLGLIVALFRRGRALKT
jgi:hypothetical protein